MEIPGRDLTKKMIDSLLKKKDDFLFNSLDLENFNNSHSKMRFWFNHLIENYNSINGDIYEFGVYRGRSLISIAILLKKLGSSKKVYGFDSFSGFPDYSENDNLDMFSYLRKNSMISDKHFEDFQLLLKIKDFNSLNQAISVKNISTSKDFSENSIETLKEKIKFLELDNIILVPGDFNKTIPEFFSEKKNNKIFSANIDSDLYDGYKLILPFAWKYLEKGGFIHLDEYYSLKFPGPRIAVDEFCKSQSISPIKNISHDTEFERWSLIK